MKFWVTLGFVCTCLVSQAAKAEGDQTQAMQALLFSDTGSRVPAVMQASIAAQLVQKGWQVQNNKMTDAKCGVVPQQLDVVDLNADGKPEVMLLVGNACTSGKIGHTIYLFTQQADGSVQRQLGFSAAGYKVLPQKGNDWAGLLFLGTGDCQPVWANVNGRYNFHHLYEASKDACKVPAGMSLHHGD